MNTRLRNINFVSNALIVALTGAAIFSMFLGKGGILAPTGWTSFKFFTVQSNVFVGFTSLLSVIFLFRKDGKYPNWLVPLKMIATVAVGVTFTTVVVYLGPIYSYPLLFEGTNLYMHLIIPVLALITFVLLEPRQKLKFRFNFINLLPVIIYGTCYLINVAVHNDYGNYYGADWYAFGTYGLGIGLVCLSVLLLVVFAISVGLYFAHQKIAFKGIHK